MAESALRDVLVARALEKARTRPRAEEIHKRLLALRAGVSDPELNTLVEQVPPTSDGVYTGFPYACIRGDKAKQRVAALMSAGADLAGMGELLVMHQDAVALNN